MKNHLGLVLAVVLGVIGAALNFLYLNNKAKNFEKVAFLGIAQDVSIQRGETFRDSHFVAVEIPKLNVGQLTERVVLYADRGTVIGAKANQNYYGGELVLSEDLKTPPAELALAEGERAMWVPVDNRTFVPALVMPGDWVSFMIPKGMAPLPVAAAPEEGSGDEQPQPIMPGDSEMVGPFKVLSIGNRLGSADVFKAAGMPQQQENVLTIAVRGEGNQLDPKGKKLWDLLQAGGFRQAGVILHPRGVEPK